MTDIYGTTVSLDELRDSVDSLFSTLFEERYSSYRGGKYLNATDANGLEIAIQRNLDISDDTPIYTEYQHYPILLFASGSLEALDLLLSGRIIESFHPLARRNLSSEGKIELYDWNGISFG